jgi:hypothetical protein
MTTSSSDLTAIASKARTERGNLIASTKSKISTYTAELGGWESSLRHLLAEEVDAPPKVRQTKLAWELANARTICDDFERRLATLARLLTLLESAGLAPVLINESSDSCFGWADATYVVFGDGGEPRETKWSYGTGDPGLGIRGWNFFTSAKVEWEDLSPGRGYPSRRAMRAAGLDSLHC